VTAARAAAMLLLAVALSACAVAPEPTQQEIEEALTCQCGCGLTVHSCNHLNCPSGEPMKREIADRLARGESKDTVLAAFTARYGEKVLSSPTFRGFNWLAWVTPFGAVLAAAGVLIVVIRRRVRTTTITSAPVAPVGTGDPALRARLARELDDLDRD
jgi:cytochrome c-type biogenesis protein CcmH/NrfF